MAISKGVHRSWEWKLMMGETQGDIIMRLAAENVALERRVADMRAALIKIARLGDNAPDTSLGRRLARMATAALEAADDARNDD